MAECMSLFLRHSIFDLSLSLSLSLSHSLSLSLSLSSITLILVTSNEGDSDVHANHLLELIFNAMVLLVGLHDLEYVSDDERLKRNLKVHVANIHLVNLLILIIMYPPLPLKTQCIKTE